MSLNELLSDIVFITIPKTLIIEDDNFSFDSSIPIPVQIADGSSTINSDSGIRVEMIAAGLIKVVAHDPFNENSHYYQQMLRSMQPDIVDELQLAAIAKANSGELDFAEELFLAASYLNPNIVEIFVNLSVLYGQKAKEAQDDNKKETYENFIQKQLNVLNRGVQNNPLSDLLLAEIGLLHLFLGNEEIAYEHLRDYLKIAKDSEKKEIIEKQFQELAKKVESEQLLQEALDEMHLANEEQALHLINSYIEIYPKAWSAYFIKGWALRRLEDYPSAREAFLKCLELGESNSDIYNELSICALEMGQRELAKDYLDIALELEAESVALLCNLALLELQDENYDKAVDLLNRAKLIDEKDPALIHLWDELTRRIGDQGEDDDIIDL